MEIAASGLVVCGAGTTDERKKMSFERRGKALATEKRYSFIIELPVTANGLDVELNRQIVGFHKARGISPRFGRTIWRNEQRYYR